MAGQGGPSKLGPSLCGVAWGSWSPRPLIAQSHLPAGGPFPTSEPKRYREIPRPLAWEYHGTSSILVGGKRTCGEACFAPNPPGISMPGGGAIGARSPTTHACVRAGSCRPGPTPRAFKGPWAIRVGRHHWAHSVPNGSFK